MFFKIFNSLHEPQAGFTKIESYYNFTIYLDNGWHAIIKDDVKIFYKGYSDNNILEEINSLIINPVPRFEGNYAVIICKNKKIILTNNIYRSFPLFFTKENCLTNMPTDFVIQPIWSKEYVTLEKEKISTNSYKFKDMPKTKISLEECVNNICQILDKKVESLRKLSETYAVPKLFLTGGLDTMLIYGLLKHHKINFELINYEYFWYSPFLLEYGKKIKEKYNMYKQMHHWKENSVLLSGCYGDPNFLRVDRVVAIWLANRNITIESINLKYQKYQFNKPEIKHTFNEIYKNRDYYNRFTTSTIIEVIFDNIVNDFQHWHLENTITWTPLKDLSIVNNILRLPDNIIIQNFEDALIEKKIIEKYDSSLLNYVAEEKNSLTSRKKLQKLFLDS